MELTICIDGNEKQLEFERKNGQYRFVIDGREYYVSAEPITNGTFAFFVGSRSYVASITKAEGGTRIAIGGKNYLVEEEGDEGRRGGAGASAHADGTVESPMPGNIVAVNVREGDTVETGQAVVVIESMKMQNEITAPVNGTVEAVNCSVGDQVNFGDVLVKITPQK